MKYRLKHLAEYGALRALSALVQIAPYRASLALGWVIARLGFHLLRWRRAEAERRIREVFKTRFDERQVRRIAWESMRNLLFNVVEMLGAASMDRRWLDRHAELDGVRSTLADQVNQKKGAILAVIHMGNWDAAGIGLANYGIPMLFIARNQRNPLFNEYMNRRRSMHQSVVVDRDDADLMRHALNWLGCGKVLAILIDLRGKERGAKFHFLGKEPVLGRGIGVIARHANVPIYPAIALRKGWARHEWKIFEPISPDLSIGKKADSVRMIEACLPVFEKVIREHPEQYFWYNKRWVLEPFEEI